MEAGDIEAICCHSENVPTIFNMAVCWYIKKLTSGHDNKREHESNSHGCEAFSLLQLIAKDIRICSPLLQPQNGFLKQLLFLALSSAANGPVLNMLSKLARQSMIVPVECSSQADVNGISELDQKYIFWAFVVG